jgi:hypothetical protein
VTSKTADDAAHAREVATLIDEFLLDLPHDERSGR